MDRYREMRDPNTTEAADQCPIAIDDLDYNVERDAADPDEVVRRGGLASPPLTSLAIRRQELVPIGARR